MKYTIQELYPSDEEGFVYADVLINDEAEPRRLILPEDTNAAKATMKEYLKAESQPEATVVAEVVELVDQTITVKA